MSKYGYTVAKKDVLASITLPDNYTIFYSDDECYGFVSGVGYGVGVEFQTAEDLKNYIYSNGWKISEVI